MNFNRLSERLEVLRRALMRFEEILKNPDLQYNDQLQDGAIQRFEFSFELCCKSLKLLLLDQGIESFGPRDVLQQAFQFGFISDETRWLAMLQMRNTLSNVYDSAQALAAIQQLASFLSAMRTVEITFEKYLAGRKA